MEAVVKDMAAERRVTQSLESVFGRKLRTDEELQAIYDLAKPLQGFDKYSEFTKRELCKVMHYARYDGVSTRVVFYEGDAPDGWYLVLSGTLHGKKLPPDTDIEELRDHGGDIEELSTAVFTLGRGKAFGEGALQRSSGSATPGLRAATIVANEPVELLKVSLEDYIKLLQIEEDKNIEATVAFLKRMPLFADPEWTHGKLRNVAQTFTVAQYMPNKLIYQQSVTHGDAFYIVKSGTCRIVKELDIPYTDRNGKEKTKKVFLHINTLEEGAHFGEYAIIEGCRRSSSVCSVSNVLLYVMPSAEFKKHIVDKTRKKLMDRILTYPSEKDIVNSYKEQQAWDRYKRKLVTQTLSYGDRASSAYQSSFRAASSAPKSIVSIDRRASAARSSYGAPLPPSSSSSTSTSSSSSTSGPPSSASHPSSLGSSRGYSSSYVPSSGGRRRTSKHSSSGRTTMVGSTSRSSRNNAASTLDTKLLRDQGIRGGGSLRSGTVPPSRTYDPTTSSDRTRLRVSNSWA